MDAREGFSIREYVLGMRNADVVKCWPFDETFSEESVRSMLPPMTVKNFVWWIDYSESSSSTADGEKKKTVVESGVPSLDDAEVVSESKTLAAGVINASSSSRSPSKARARKKRSILEIFAAAPPVERVSEEDELGLNCGLEGKKKPKPKPNMKKKLKKHKQIVSSELKKATKVINKMKKATSSSLQRGGDQLDLSARQLKENCVMQKLQDRDKAVRNRTRRKNGNDIHDRVSLSKENQRLQHLDATKNTASCTAFRLFVQSQRRGLNIKPGILKNRAKAFSLQQSSLPNHDGKQKRDKHVTFLEKDSLVRRRRKPFTLKQSSKLLQSSASDLHNAHHPGSLGKESTIVETVESEGASNMEDEVDCRPTSKEDSTIPLCPVEASTFMRQQCNKEEPLRRSTDGKTQDWCNANLVNTSCEAYHGSRNTKAIAVPSSSTGGKLIKDFGTMYNVPSVSNVWQRASSQADGYRAENICGKRIGGIHEDFVGLPLNSNGELFMQSSNGKGGLNETMARNTTATPSISLSVPNAFSKPSEHSSWDCRTSSRDCSSLFPSNGYLKENHTVIFPSRFGMNGYQGNRRANLDHSIQFSNHSFCQEDYSQCKEGGQIPEAYGNEKILPTMRLMGKDFIVGGQQGFQEFDNGHVWKDKHIIDEFHLSNMSIDNRVMHDRNHPSLGKLRETFFHPLDITTVNHGSTNSSFPHFERSYHSFSQGAYPSLYSSEPSWHESQIHQVEIPTTLASNQHPGPGSRSTIKYSFMHSDLEGCVQSSWTRSPQMNRTPLFLDGSEKGTILMSKFPCHHNFGSGSHHPGLIPGTNHWADSSAPLKPKTSSANNLFGSTLQNHPTLLTQQVPVLSFPAVLPMSSVRKRHGNEKINSRIGFRARLHGGIAKGQPSAIPNASLKTARALAFVLEEGSQRDNTKSTNFEDARKIESAMESCPVTNKFDTSGDDQNDLIRSHSWTDSCTCTAKACHSNTLDHASGPGFTCSEI